MMWGENPRLLDVVEAGYEIGRGEDAWIRGIAERVHPLIDEGLGTQTGTYELQGDRLHISALVSLGESAPRVYELMMKILARTDHRPMIAAYLTLPVCTMTQGRVRNQQRDPLWQRVVRETGVHDVLKVAITDPSGRGFSFGANLGRARSVSPREGARLGRVGAHLQTAFRARAADRTTPGDDAVLRPDGRVEHAEREATDKNARASLRDAARAIDRARGRQRTRDPDGALEAWRALVDGRWTLLEQFESDGRRFLIARRNEPRGRSRDGLTASETVCAVYASMGHSGKLIAYELGVAESTVSTHVRRAMRKLRLRSRAELAKALGGPG
jgi:DNA-binding CsgD family transcriptional regulator